MCEEATVYVGNIGWSQDSILGRFQNGSDIQNAVNALRALTTEQRQLVVAEYPLIIVDFNT